MSLASWAETGWLQTHTTSGQEMTNLLAIVDRELHDASVTEISQDAQLGMLYHAALRLADVALRGAGYRAARGGSQHHRIIMSLPFAIGAEWQETADALDATRVLRNRADYESVGFATQQQLEELRNIVLSLRDAVLARSWHSCNDFPGWGTMHGVNTPNE